MKNDVFKDNNLIKAHTADAGKDIRSAETVKLLPNTSHKFSTGLHIAIPSGYEGCIRPRSGMGFKYDVMPFMGTIDATYRGEVQIKLYNLGDTPYQVNKGDRIAQLVVSPCRLDQFIEVDELPGTDEGMDRGGFGDSGR